MVTLEKPTRVTVRKRPDQAIVLRDHSTGEVLLRRKSTEGTGLMDANVTLQPGTYVLESQ
jgi:hypothetical protein